MPRLRPAGETPEQRILRKAADIRDAMIQSGAVISPEPSTPFEDLPPVRQERWIHVARAYCEVF